MDQVSKVGDTPEHAWILEYLDRCFPEVGGRVNADVSLAMAMCKAEPKYAQVAMQWLAQEIKSGHHDETRVAFLRFALGVLYTAYTSLADAEGRSTVDDVPLELQSVVRQYPEIIA